MRVSEWLRVGLHVCVFAYWNGGILSGHAALERSSVLQQPTRTANVLDHKEGRRTPNPLSRNMQKSLRADTPRRFLWSGRGGVSCRLS